jgi:uncharacterized phage protein (TIGR02220 family)
MEVISFLKKLKHKSVNHYDVWLSILFKLEESKLIELHPRLDLPKTNYYRIINYGIKLWNESFEFSKLEMKYGKMQIIESKEILTNKTKKPKEVKVKKVEFQDIQNEVIENKIDMDDVYESIIQYLNLKANTNFKSKTSSYRTFINARFNVGHKIEDFYQVIDIKSSEWIGTDFQKFLRPETLFGNKFGSYLNQKIVKKTNQDIAYEQVSKATELGWNNNKI